MSRNQDGLPRGRISSGITPNTLVRKTIEFVYENLPEWRDDPSRLASDSEFVLNSQLCDYLDAESRNDFPMVQFKHEEDQGGRRTVDLAAKPTKGIRIRSCDYTIYDPILVLEGKRLPLPTSDREKEYFTTFFENKVKGGIQRFRTGAHGSKLTTVVMIGYIQKKDAAHWHRKINVWILEECVSKLDQFCTWSVADLLQKLTPIKKRMTSRCSSTHSRTTGKTNQIAIKHLWVEMGNSKVA